jgi:hypothetical protein
MRRPGWFVDCKLSCGTAIFSREMVLRKEIVKGNYEHFLDDYYNLTGKEVIF